MRDRERVAHAEVIELIDIVPELVNVIDFIYAQGSVLSFVIMLLYIPIIAKRIRNEEEVLEKGLEGYAEYKKKVRYKVIPFIW